MYDKLVTNVNAVHTGGFLLKAQYNIDKRGLKKLMMLTKEYLILVDLLKNQIIMLGSLKLKVKYLVMPD